MKKSWKARLISIIDSIDFVVIMMLLVFCMLGVFLTISFIAALIFGVEALTNLVLWLIVILSPFIVFAMLAFATRR